MVERRGPRRLFFARRAGFGCGLRREGAVGGVGAQVVVARRARRSAARSASGFSCRLGRTWSIPLARLDP